MLNQVSTPQISPYSTNLESQQQNVQSPYNFLNNLSQHPNLARVQNQQPTDQSNAPQQYVFVPVVYNSQPYQGDPYIQVNNLQQPILNNQLNNKEIKNSPFNEQKEILYKVLGIIAAGTILEYFFFFILMAMFYKIMDQIALIMFPISLILLFVITKIGSDKNLIQKIHPAIVFILISVLTAQTLIFFSRSFNHTKPPNADGIYFTTADVVWIGVLFQIGINGLITLFTLIYLLIESKKIQYLPILAFFGLCSIIAIACFQPFCFNCLASIVYAILLINGLIQITEGRFQLETDNLLQITNSVYFTLIIPFNTSE